MQAQVAIVDISQTKKEISLEFAAGIVKAEFDKAYNTLSQQVKWPGFRPGHVPREMLRNRFGKEVKDQVLKELVPHALEHVIKDYQLNYIGQAEIAELILEENEPLRCKVNIEVMPEFELRQYKGLKATKRVKPVTEGAIDNVLARWQESLAEFAPIEDRASQAGDFVSVNLVGKFADEPEAEELKAEGAEVELGSAGVLPEFDQHLTGVRAGDVREFRATYPEDFQGEKLAGKTLDFTVTVVAVRRKEVPELDDDFAKELGSQESLVQLRERVRMELQLSMEREAEGRVRDKLLRQLLRRHPFQVPEAMIKQRAVEIVENTRLDLLRQGVSPETISKLNWEERGGQVIQQAANDIRLALLLARINAAENMTVTSGEIEREITRMAVASNTTTAELKARLTKENALSSIENQLLFQKAQEFIVNHAEIKTEELAADQDDQEADEPAATAGAEQAKSAEQQAE